MINTGPEPLFPHTKAFQAKMKNGQNMKRNFVYNAVWMQETTQGIIKPFGLLLPDLLSKKCSYQTSL